MNFQNILKKAEEYSQQGHFSLDGAVFGSDDFVADIGEHNFFFLVPCIHDAFGQFICP